MHTVAMLSMLEVDLTIMGSQRKEGEVAAMSNATIAIRKGMSRRIANCGRVRRTKIRSLMET